MSLMKVPANYKTRSCCGAHHECSTFWLAWAALRGTVMMCVRCDCEAIFLWLYLHLTQRWDLNTQGRYLPSPMVLLYLWPGKTLTPEPRYPARWPGTQSFKAYAKTNPITQKTLKFGIASVNEKGTKNVVDIKCLSLHKKDKHSESFREFTGSIAGRKVVTD